MTNVIRTSTIIIVDFKSAILFRFKDIINYKGFGEIRIQVILNSLSPSLGDPFLPINISLIWWFIYFIIKTTYGSLLENKSLSYKLRPLKNISIR